MKTFKNNEEKKVTKLSKRHRKTGIELICPLCGATWVPGHFSWIAFCCESCGAEIEKTEWLIEVKGDKGKPVYRYKIIDNPVCVKC